MGVLHGPWTWVVKEEKWTMFIRHHDRVNGLFKRATLFGRKARRRDIEEGSNKERAGPGTKTKAETAAAAVTQYAQNKSVARLREASHESSVLSAGGGRARNRPTIPPPLPVTAAREAVENLGPPPLPSPTGHPHGHPQSLGAPVYDENISTYSDQYSASETITFDVEARTTVSTVGNTTATTTANGLYVVLTAPSTVTAGAGTTAPAGGWPISHQSTKSQQHQQPRGPSSSVVVTHGNPQANVGSAAFAAHVHAKWLDFTRWDTEVSSRPDRQLSSRVLMDSGCPLRCVKVAGLYADKDEPENKEVELLVGSNNKSVTLLRTQTYVTKEPDDPQERSQGSSTYIQREWIDTHREVCTALTMPDQKQKYLQQVAMTSL